MEAPKLAVDEDSFLYRYYRFEDRQAGIGLVYCPQEERYFYNVYCADTKLVKDIFAVEFEFLVDALETLQKEFGQWQCIEIEDGAGGCGSCAAK